ncbi:MAG: DNA polymerase III subunit gamma/tau [Thermomicrobiales bacterium]
MSDASLFNLNALETDLAPGGGTMAPMTASEGSHSQSLSRKYRPQTFAEDDLFGQEHVVNTLRNAIALNRIGHAYLFCGPRGTGKTTTARLLAKAVNCLEPDPYKRPCNVCASCVAINKGATTDVIEIDAASNRGIDDIRDLRERVKYAPTQLRTKFYIIDEAHQITGAAANAFLKTLEEPPAHTKFVLATTDPEELLQTIVSRCQRFDFRRINLEAMQACLRKVAHEEHIEIEPEAVQAIARHANGSLRDALGLLDQVAVYRENDQDTNTTVTLDLVRTVLGVSRNDRVEAIISSLADRDPGPGLRSIGEAVDAGEDMRQLGRQLVAYIRLLLLQRAGGTADADDSARQLADRFQLNELAALTQLFADIDYKVKHATLSQLPLELAIVEGALRGQVQQSTPVAANHSTSQQDMTGSAPAPMREVRENRQEWSPPTPTPTTPETDRMPERPRTSLRDRVRGQSPAPSERGMSASPQTPQPPREMSSSARQAPPNYDDAPPPLEPYSDVPDFMEPRRQTPELRQASSKPTSSPSRTQPSPQASSERGAAAPVPDASPAPIPSSGPPASFEAIIDLWPKIRADVKAVNRRIEALLQQVDPVSITADKLILMSAYEFHRNRVNSDEARIIIEDVVTRLLGRRLVTSCVTREEAQSLIQSRTIASSQSASHATPSQPEQVASSAPQEQPQPRASRPARSNASHVASIDAKADGTTSAPTPQESPAEQPAGTVNPLADDLVKQRVNAVKNIFDAEEFVEVEDE